MAEEIRKGVPLEEEIIEKKPTAPTEIVLMILTTICLALAIYLVGDELGFYAKKADYEQNRRASWYYGEFEKKVEERFGEEAPEPEIGGPTR